MALYIFRFIPFRLLFRFPFRVLVTPVQALAFIKFSLYKQHVRIVYK